MAWDFHVGQKVVCIEAFDCSVLGGYYAECSYPVVGQIYTIRRVGSTRMGLGLLLAEIVNPIGDPLAGFDGETGFQAKWFRPLQKRQTDISVFTKLLNTIPAKQSEDA